MKDIDDYPELKPFIDPIADGATVEKVNDQDFLVTIFGEEGGQILLRKQDHGIILVAADNVLGDAAPFFAPQTCSGPCSSAQHAQVATAIIDKVDKFSSATGPDGGNLACVWAVRHIVREVLGFWITRSDGTAVFDPALAMCFGSTRPVDEVLPGGIVISPTSGSRIGHVGLLGTGSGDSRLIYSNSSKAAMWKQNFTVGSWRARYQDQKALPVHFFPLPLFG